MKKQLNLFIIILFIFTLLFSFMSCNRKLSKVASKLEIKKQHKIKIGVAMPDSDRWKKQDFQFILDEVETSTQLELYSFFSNDGSTVKDHQNQLEGVKKLISDHKIDYLILAVVNTNRGSEIVDYCTEKNVVVVAYDRNIKYADIDILITFDGNKIGRIQARYLWNKVGAGDYLILQGNSEDENAVWFHKASMRFLQKYIDDDKINIVLDTSAGGWSTEETYLVVKELLEEGKNIDAILAPNDGTAMGAIKALKEFDLAGRVPVSGLDGIASSVELIEEGSQSMTIYKDLKLSALAAVNAILQHNDGIIPFYNSYLFNGKNKVPVHFVDVTLVDKSNLDLIR